ncbi:UNVERIFIED_CONTAM: hypothetical protein PYX00_002361 [Menopon gallinae]|uniref:Nucleoside diphosphate kinase homolog 5 n=1 Tax=Menopon gallinae TaxID=328185 RepID=A0AAW2IIK7_9NEOP
MSEESRDGERPGEMGGEDMYNYQTPPVPDSFWTPTVCPESEHPYIIRGDFRMDPEIKCSPDLTLALIKPDGMKYLDEIESLIREQGFYVVQRRLVHLSPEQASNFYKDHYGEPFYPALVTAVSAGPIKVLVLRAREAVERWKHICGPRIVAEARKMWPESLRALYGTPGEDHKNVCHGSATPEKALEEIRFFFPHMILDPNILDEIQVEDYLRDYVNPTLLEGLTQVCKHKPIDPVLWLAEWLLMNNPYKPKMERLIALTPT